MENSNPTEDELIARTDSRHRIGRDATGAGHYYCNYLGVVWTVADEDIEHVEETRNLGKWRRFIAAQRGWTDHCIDERTDAEVVLGAAESAAGGA